jgi:hypothetical protein
MYLLVPKLGLGTVMMCPKLGLGCIEFGPKCNLGTRKKTFEIERGNLAKGGMR